MRADRTTLRVRLLGGLVVDGLAPSELGSRKARLLVKVLALARGAPVPLATLADALWADQLPARPADQLGVLASRLRGVLGRDRLVRSDAGLALVVDWLDVDELAALVQEASSALAEGRIAAARAAATAAAALVRGPLLPDDDGEWLAGERHHADALSTRARAVVAAAALAAGDHLAAELAAQAALARDPYDESTLRVLMRAQVGAGRPAAALAAYAHVRERLAEDLGVSPDADTERLHTTILLGPDPTPEPPPIVDGAGGRVADRVGGPVVGRVVGREVELATLAEHLEAARRGEVRLVSIEGEPGIGKTMLVEHFAAQARAQGLAVFVAVADELGRDLPLQPVLDAIGRVAERLDGLGRSDLTPLVGDGGRGGAAATTMPDAAVERVAWFASVLRCLPGAAAEGAATEGATGEGPAGGVGDAASGPPAVLVVENVHEADPATRAWLVWAQRRAGAVLLLATSRPGHVLPGAQRLALGPLGVEAVADLIGDVPGDDRAAEVHQRSGGNPLLALAIASAPAGDLPATVREAAGRAIAGLDAAVADVVRAAAVLGSEVDVELLAAVLRLAAVDVIGRLETAMSQGVLVERGMGFGFRHAVIREALEQGTGAARRALLQREAARTLDERPRRDPLVVAVHARRGGATELAARAFAEAAAVSFERADLAAAEEHLRASLQASETASVQESLARVLMVALRYDEAAAAARRALELGAGPSALEVAGWIEYYRRRYDGARLFADEAAARAERHDAVHASGLALGGRVRHGTGDLAGAEQRLVDALDGPPAVRGVAEVWLGQVRLHEGRPQEALALNDRALVDPDHLAHPFGGLHGRFGRIMALGQLGRVADGLLACDGFDVAIERSGAIGARFGARALNVRAWLLRGSGRGDEADERNLAALERNRAADGNGPESESAAEAYWVALLDLAEGRLAAHDPAGAEALLVRLSPVDTWQGAMAWHQRHRLGLLRARSARAQGDLEGCAQLAGEVAADADRRGAGRYAALARAQLHLSGADDDRERVEATIGVLRSCAALEGWALVAELAARFDVGRWRTAAVDWAAAVAEACPPEGVEAARRMLRAALG